MGPAIVTADEIADPHQLAICLSINGETLQNSNTRELVFKIPELIEYISSITPLLPRRHRLYRHASGRGHGPHAAALAQTRRYCHGDYRRPWLAHQSRRRGVISISKNALDRLGQKSGFERARLQPCRMKRRKIAGFSP